MSFYVGNWHKCDVPTASSNVRFQGESGRHLLTVSSSLFDPFRTCSAGGLVNRMQLLNPLRRRRMNLSGRDAFPARASSRSFAACNEAHSTMRASALA